MARLRCALLVFLLAAAAAAGPATPEVVKAARKERRQRLAAELKGGYALVLGQPLTDILHPRQEGHFLYLTGVEEPSAALLLAGTKAKRLKLSSGRGAHKVREVVFLRHRKRKMAQFYGVRLLPGPLATRRLGVETTRAAPRGAKGLARELARLLPKRALLHIPSYRGLDHATVREIRDAVEEALEEERPDIKLVDLHGTLSRMRSRKDAIELDALTRAIEVSHFAFRQAAPLVRPGSSEGAVDGALLAAVRARGGFPAYPFVVGSGPNSTIPHYFRNSDPLDEGELLVIDAGAAVDRYAADITRTFPVSGRFTARQREVYEVVLEAQLAAIAAVKPGSTLARVHRAARAVIDRAGLAKYFIHGTCHHVGLDVHDPGPTKIEPGMTFTVEPGVYIPEEGIGVRIEDIVLVTKRGARVLGEPFPKTADEIEAMLARSRER